MTEVVWVALISAGGALIAAIVTQYLATRAAHTQAAREERREALQWQRSEAKRLQEQHEARLRELWGHVLQTQSRMVKLLESVAQRGGSVAPSLESESASMYAAQAYAVALIAVPNLREAAKAFYMATAELETDVTFASKGIERGGVSPWRQAFVALEARVAEEAECLGNLPKAD